LKSVLKGLLVLISLGFLSGLFVLGVIIYISFDLPQINSLADYNPPIPSKIYSKDGELLLEIYKEKRDIAEMDEIPQLVIDSFLAAEDDNFYNHSGVDYIGIMRAMLKNIKAGRIVQGASTITQQVAKSLLLTSERTFTRKIKDLLLAKRIEDKFTKAEILFLYLNQVYLGGGYYGIKSAFKGYFDKELSEATIAEAALVAGLLVAPGRYSPYVNPQYAKTRQKYVLGRLLKTGKISEVDYETAMNENIRMKIKEPNLMKAGYFTDWIRQRLVSHFGKKDFLTNGYTVTTTIDWALQKKAEEEVKKGVEEIDKRQGFKGPVEVWESEELQLEKLLAKRKSIYEEASNYFTFYSDGSVKNEFEFTEGELEKILEAQKAEIETVSKRYKVYFEPGNLEEDNALKLLNLEKDHLALVTKVSNSQKLIYVNIGGIKAVIPYSGFQWAHKREIKEERNYWSYQKYPEQILKPNDVVWVRVRSHDQTTIDKVCDDDFLKRYKTKKDKEIFSSQKFLIADLTQDPEAQGALISISPQSGEIIAMVGGSDFEKSQFNRAVQSNRQPGSAFKPIIYASGLENGFTPASILLDSPQALGGVDDSLSWKPRNYDGKFKGEMTFRRALETSRNIPTIRLSQQVGVDKIKDLVNRVKVDAELPNDLSVSLGSFGINLLDLVKLYAIFPNGGRKVKIKSIISIKGRDGELHYLEDKDQDPGTKDDEALEEKVAELKAEPSEEDKGKTSEEEEKPEEEIPEEKINPFLVNLNEDQVYDSRLAYIMTNLLKGVIQNGTGRGASNISSFIGGKTGTTNNYVDAWFLGFSSKLVTGVWTGFDNNDTLGWGETGAKSALPIWKAFMNLGIQRYGEHDFTAPSGIVNVSINPVTGKLSKSGGQTSFMEAFVEGTEPGNEEEEIIETEENDDSINYVDEDYYISQ
jgi:penicillin-binding protein 1A